MEDWANLPWPALNLISNLLPFGADYNRFRAVCNSWRCSAPKRRHLPILAGHHLDDNGSLTVFNFSSFNGSQITLLDNDSQLCEVALGRLCCGSSHGWMAFLDESPGINLWNPTTNSHIELPTITRFPNVGDRKVSKVRDFYVFRYGEGYKETYIRSFEEMQRYLANKVVLSCDPWSGGDCMALLIHCRWRRMSICRLGDDAWKPLRFREFGSFHTDALFYRGRFHIVSRLALYVLNVGEELVVERIPVANPPFDSWPRLPEIDECYLVESDGDLLLVNAYYSAQGYGYDRIYWFEVYKVDWGLHRVKLLKLKSIGDRALFLGRNQSFSLCASKFPGCRADCIYLAEYYKASKVRVRVYNLEDGSNDFISNSSQTDFGWRPCAWVMPSML